MSVHRRVRSSVLLLSAGVITGLLFGGVASANSPHDTTTTTMPATTTTSPPTTVHKRNVEDPFNAPRFAAYLRDRTNDVTAAVYDVKSGKTYVYNYGTREKTASMAKIDILADLLYESQRSGVPLTPKQNALATVMIEQSNNQAADKLWTAIGGYEDFNAFNKLIGFSQTIPSYDWGQIETTPLDQLKLLKVIALPNKILNTASRTYEMNLMEHVLSSERFGLGWGSPTGALVGQKNGWYPETDTGWQLNSTGYVEFHGRFYLATIMNTKNPDEAYGISTLTQIATYIWQFLKP